MVHVRRDVLACFSFSWSSTSILIKFSGFGQSHGRGRHRLAANLGNSTSSNIIYQVTVAGRAIVAASKINLDRISVTVDNAVASTHGFRDHNYKA
jgi:hypothetical protein